MIIRHRTTRIRSAFALLASAVLLVGVAPAPARAQGDAALARAKALMREVPLIDGHNDLAWEIRAQGHLSFDSLDIANPQPTLMTDIPRLRAGLVGGQFWSTYTPSDADHPARMGMEQGDVIHRMVARYPDVFEMAGTADDIVRIHRAGKIASMLGLEGGHMIENSLGLLRAFYRDGVRYMTLTHAKNTDWADAATDTPAHGGLTRFGEEVVREMNRLGMLVDLSHVSDSTMWDALRVSEAPVIFSHSSSRHFTPHPRNVPDDVARAVGTKGGVIMVTFVGEFDYLPTYEYANRRDSLAQALFATLGDSAKVRDSVRLWMRTNPMPMPDIGVIADEIEYLRDVAGVDHVGIGSDFDGIGAGPIGLEDVSTFPALVAELLRRGWSDGDVKRVIGLNVLRVMREAERVAARLQRERPPSTAQIELLDGWPTASHAPGY
jgi:membrane dipeptidase